MGNAKLMSDHLPTPSYPRFHLDAQQVPVRHFGVILDLPAREALAARLPAAGVKFVSREFMDGAAGASLAA